MPIFFWVCTKFMFTIRIIFNILNTETWGRTICISDYENFFPIRLSIKDEKINNIEKNWTPFVKDNKLFFIYSYDPLIVLSYDFNSEGVCNIIYKENNVTIPFDFKYIRGSSNLIQLCDEYYIGFVHSTCLQVYFGAFEQMEFAWDALK